jgi:hypothetical protein
MRLYPCPELNGVEKVHGQARRHDPRLDLSHGTDCLTSGDVGDRGEESTMGGPARVDVMCFYDGTQLGRRCTRAYEQWADVVRERATVQEFKARWNGICAHETKR